jgi:hypothetical protein
MDNSSATFVANAGIPVFIDDKHKIAHNKATAFAQEATAKNPS